MIIIHNEKELHRVLQDDRFQGGAERCGVEYQGNEQVLGVYTTDARLITPVVLSHEFYEEKLKEEKECREHQDNDFRKLKDYLAQEKT